MSVPVTVPAADVSADFGSFGLRAEGLIRNEQFEHHEPMINVGLRIPFGSNPPKPVLAPPPPTPTPRALRQR